MFFINKVIFTLFMFISFSSLSGIGIASYLFLMKENRKSLAEALLFTAIVGGVLLIVLMLYLIFFSRRKVKNMEKIINIARTNGVLAQERFKEFGALGMSLKILYREILEISERRASRIFLLNNLIENLLGFVNEPLLIVDATGRIMHADEKYIAQFSPEAPLMQDTVIMDLYPKIDFKAIVQEAMHTHTVVEYLLEKDKLYFYPVHGKTNSPDVFCVAFGKISLFSLPKMTITKKTEEKKSGFSFFDRFKKREVKEKIEKPKKEEKVKKIKEEKKPEVEKQLEIID